MIYVDSSVALASILDEASRPPESFWDAELFSSRLLEYEIWTVLNARGENQARSEAATALLGRVMLVELDRDVLERVLEPFPTLVRALDAIHLASADYLRRQGQVVEFASYDRRQLEAARRLELPQTPLLVDH